MFWNKKKKSKNQLKIYTMYTLGFILAVSVALPAYIQSSFLEAKIKIELVSLFFVAANVVTALAISFFPHLIRRIGSYLTARGLVIAYALALIALAISKSPLAAILSLLLFIVFSNLLWISIDIILESASLDHSTGQTRTIYLSLANLGWILAPVVSARLVDVSGYFLPFLISALLAIPILIIIIVKKKSLKDNTKNYCKENLTKSWKKLWRNKNLRGVFIAAIALNIFFSGAVLYIPLYLHQNIGLEWSQLGWIFSFMLIPFVLIQVPSGWLADKYLGEKEMLISGLLILIISLLVFSYLTSTNPWAWALILFTSRIGAALVEAMRDTYFFKKVSDRDLGFINIFRMTGPLGYILGAAMASLALLFMPLGYIFITFAILLTPSLYFVLQIKDTK